MKNILFIGLILSLSACSQLPKTELVERDPSAAGDVGSVSKKLLINRDYMIISPYGVEMIVPKSLKATESDPNCFAYFCKGEIAVVDGVTNYSHWLGEEDFNTPDKIIGFDKEKGEVIATYDPTLKWAKKKRYKLQDLFTRSVCSRDFCVGDYVIAIHSEAQKKLAVYGVTKRESCSIVGMSLDGKLLLRVGGSSGGHVSVKPDQVTVSGTACNVPVEREGCRHRR
ncbi:MAG: hypothetical protein ACK5P7_08795 [Bdellovibrio sp.]|jgi:hypothetical protein